ncbi:MAG: GerMN domain-containing protein [Spirochaetia bacterium]|nr:GerMN domain-containing protein [Spirochaetia bacterium]
MIVPVGPPGKEQGGTQTLDTEATNRGLLVLTGLFLLLVFMDTQARRHYRSLLPKQNGIERSVSDAVRESGLPGTDTIKSGAKSIFEQADDAVRPELSALKAAGMEAAGSPRLKALSETNEVSLYFIRFRGGRSELVRVKRRIDSVPTPATLLELLRQGPGSGERGLLNTFDANVKGVSVENGIATVDLDERAGRMGQRVIKDRLDQMTMTLSQLPGIKGVRVLINGRQVETLGADRFRLPSVLRKPERFVSDFIR